MSPLVSVIIPVYNAAPYIGETVQSVLDQSYEEFELIIVDDGSTDETSAIVNALAVGDNRIAYFRQHNQGVSIARNYGYSRAKGQYIAFLDADDVWLPDNLSSKVEKMESADYGLVHSDGSVVDQHSKPTGKILQGREGNLIASLLAWDGSNIPGPSSILVKRAVIDSVGGFDEHLSTSADHDFFFRVCARYQIGRVPRITWRYREHPTNMHRNIATMEHDVLYVYSKARQAGLFQSAEFRRRCFASMYLVLAASWAGDGKNSVRGIWFLTRALMTHSSAWGKVFRKLVKYG